MPKVYLELAPVFLIIFSGTALRYFKILAKEDATIILNVVFYFSLPALILGSIPNVVLERDFIFLPIVPIIIALTLFLIAVMLGKYLKLERKTLGVFVISSLIMNTAFAYPFALALFGHDGLARILIFDIGNSLLVYGFAYYQACKFGNHQIDRKKLIKRLVTSLPLWSIVIALILNFAGIKTDGFLHGFLKMAGDLTIPLLLVSVGVLFDPKLVNIKAMSYALFIRMVLGIILGLALVKLFQLEGLTSYIVILATATPIGYNTLTFSSIEKLDSEFAAALISVSILISLFYIPAIVFFLIK
jgi:malate permease and related proteins